MKLPPTLKLQKAKVLLLRVTIPINFYTSPITIDVDGVDVRLRVLSPDHKPSRRAEPKTPEDSTVGLNTVDLAQSFLDTQPVAERKKLEEALTAETQDLGASVSMSDDGSEDEQSFGTGQPLSLPAFLADFLQSIVDKMQVRIKAITFQLDLDVPLEAGSSNTEPVSFQIALEGVDVEGVTTQAEQEDGTPAIIHREGKRHVLFSNIRAFLISEATVFSALARSPSLASPSSLSSPAMTRNPPSRQTSSLSEGNFHDEPMESLQASFRSHISAGDAATEPAFPLGDSEEALSIPYDLSDTDNLSDIESPATPRASVYHEPHPDPEESVFHSSLLPPDDTDPATITLPQSLPESAASESEILEAMSIHDTAEVASSVSERGAQEVWSRSTAAPERSADASVEDLMMSRVYTHEDAESMYMSAFTQPGESRPDLDESEDEAENHPLQQSVEPQTPHTTMPGGWSDSPESSPKSERKDVATALESSQEPMRPDPVDDSDSGDSSPAFSRASLPQETERRQESPSQNTLDEDLATPKGPTRMVKEILSLKQASIYLPSQHQHIRIENASAESIAQLPQALERSTYPQAPGAFSMHEAVPKATSSAASHTVVSENSDNSVELSLSPLSVNLDASIGFLLAIVAGKLFEIAREYQNTAESPKVEDNKNAKAPELKLSVEEISLNFMDRLSGVADTSERYLNPTAFLLEQNILLNAKLHDLTVSMCQDGPTRIQPVKGYGTLTRIEVGSFRFGYSDGDIISFDKSRPMSTSVRDTFLADGHDVGIKIVQTPDKTRTDVETKPLVVQIDLQRLDETFSWFGGLSSFLNMSSSMTSANSPALKSTPASPQKPRGVRFETPIDPEDKSAAAANKVNLRIGGALVELVGKDCSVAAESSAIKVVSRDEGVGLACTRLRVSGPYLRRSEADPAVNTDITGIRLDFLTTPNNADLERLLELITPSKVQFDGQDEIMVDTLLRQRRKGPVLRTSIDMVNVRVKNLAQLQVLPHLGEEIAKLSTVAKYLPEDDRPGLLTLGNLGKCCVNVELGGKFGHVETELKDLDVAHISVPALVAVQLHGICIRRNESEDLLNSLAAVPQDLSTRGPVIMVRMIGDEIEPVTKLKLRNLNIEYRVPTIMDILGLSEDTTPQEFEESLAASVANLGDQAHATLVRQPSSPIERPQASKPMTLDIGLQDCLLGLNPYKLQSKMVVALTDAHIKVVLPKDAQTKAVMDINKASILLTDDVSHILQEGSSKNIRRVSSSASRQVTDMCSRGFVDICYISSAKALVNVMPGENGEKQVDVELRDDLLVLESCADSTQTLITIVNALKPPTPPSKENRYKTKVMPVQNLLASISAEAFGRPEGEYDFDQDFASAQELAGSASEMEYGSDEALHVDAKFYASQSEGEEIFDAMAESGLSHGTRMQDTNEGVLLTGFNPDTSGESTDGEGLLIQEDFYGSDSEKQHRAKVWNSSKNRYDKAPNDLVKRSSLRLSVRDVHAIWNLFDGYDWAHTREVINKAVQEVETKALDRQSRHGGSHAYEEEAEDEEAISDFLFNSIYIGIPANRDPQELSRAINEGLNDNATETESIATTTATATTSRTARPHQTKSRRLRLNRSKHHKITFELIGVNADVFVFPPDGGETQSSIDVRIENLDIFDHVPTSTWKKFATYDQDKGAREMGTSMVHIELLNVKPLPELGASESVLRATVLPLRLHVDQDALDFITRFFEFKDDNIPVHASKSDVPFIQRAEVKDILVKLDFKPKRVDYAGLRSGHTTEFMNFIVLDEARMVLRHVIIYGVSGFDRLGKTLNDIWMPDVRTNQLPGVVAGLAPVRSLVNIGSGFRDLVEIPLREYQKDGRVVRSISKGAMAFARTTGTELVKLGAKLAVGTQYALQGAEGMLLEQPQQPEGNWDDDDIDMEEKKQISLYAEQPTGVIQGIRGGFRSLARDVNLARDAIIAVPGEVMESQSASGAAKAVWKRAPTIIFRPAVGVSKAIGQTLMGATNAIDPQNKRRIDEVSPLNILSLLYIH